MNGELVECPVCRGDGMLSNGHRDPQLVEDGDCHACSGGGSVTREHHTQLLDSMTDDAAAAARHRLLADDVAAQRERDGLATERDREWWS